MSRRLLFPQAIGWRSHPVLICILLINLAVYLAGQVLQTKAYCYGGLFAYGVIGQGEYWRILTSMFMHYDLSHFVFNSVALFIFGAYAENFWGRWRFLLIYMSAGIFANLIAVAFAYLNNLFTYCAIGASASILGIMSATAYLMWRRWIERRDPLALTFARQLAIIFALQFVLDFILPQTSSLHHITGALVGLLLAGLFLFLRDSFAGQR